jgi:hypothetical protein
MTEFEFFLPTVKVCPDECDLSGGGAELIRDGFAEVFLPRATIVMRPALADALVVVRGNANVDEVDLGAACYGAEAQNQD